MKIGPFHLFYHHLTTFKLGPFPDCCATISLKSVIIIGAALVNLSSMIGDDDCNNDDYDDRDVYDDCDVFGCSDNDFDCDEVLTISI